MRRITPDGSDADLSDGEILEAYTEASAASMMRVNMVTSLDGASDVAGLSLGLSSGEDRRLLTLLRVLADVLLVGAGTLRRENYAPLVLEERFRDWRLQHGLAADPRLVIVSAQLDLDPGLRALAEAPVAPLIFTHEAAPDRRRRELTQVAEVVDAGSQRVDLSQMVAALVERGYDQILCEGGPHLLGGLTDAGLIDEFCLTITPLLAGPDSGRITAGLPSGPPRRFRLQQLLGGDQGELFARYKYCNESG